MGLSELHVTVQLFYPVLLLPGLIWIILRILPLVRDVGTARLYLLVLMVAGLLAVQLGRVQRSAYPLATWTMYSPAEVEPVAWRFIATRTDGLETDFPWDAVAPVRSVRAFELNLARLASDVASGAATGEELDEMLRRLAEIHNTAADRIPFELVRVKRCRLDILDFPGRDGLACEVIRSVSISEDASGEAEESRAP